MRSHIGITISAIFSAIEQLSQTKYETHLFKHVDDREAIGRKACFRSSHLSESNNFSDKSSFKD